MTHGLMEVLAEVRLIGEAAPDRDIAQGSVGLKHVLSGQLHPAPDHKSVRRLPEGELECAREVRLAALDE
jgi:hypothetical protein